MVNKIISVFCLLFFSIIFLSPHNLVYAFELYDDFNTYNASFWNYYPNNLDSVKLTSDSSIIISSENPNSYPYLITNLTGQDITEVEFKLMFSGSPNYGAGIILTDNIFPYGTSRGDVWDKSAFVLWAKPNTGFVIGTHFCNSTVTSCTENILNDKLFEGLSGKFYKVKITYVNSIYKLFVDDILVFESFPTNKKIKYFWMGNPTHTGNVSWPSIEIDYVKINNPTPKKSPIIILPGAGASWDFGAILNGTHGTDWQVPDFVDTYKGLIASFERVGYKKDKDLFLYPYDWRRPIDSLSNDLKTFIDSKVPDGQKAYIIGHSMGGLVARDYVHKNGSEKINKVFTLGSPHLGALDAYSVWEGATLWKDAWWTKAALELTIQLNQKSDENRVDTVRIKIPSFKDILPTYDYLSFDGKLMRWNELKQVNSYWAGRNESISSVLSNIYAISGGGEQTKAIVNVTNRSNFDKLFGMWEDGKPVKNNPFVFADGDGTVINTSALANFTNTSSFVSGHPWLPSNRDVLENIFDQIGLDKTKIELSENINKTENVFIASLRSPGILNVCNEDNSKCNENLGVYLPGQDLFMLPGYNDEKLNITIEADTTGDYKLHFGRLNKEADWKVIAGKLNRVGQVDTYVVGSTSEGIYVIPNKSTSEELLMACKNRLDLLSSGWDKYKNVEGIINSKSSVNTRLKFVKVVKLILESEIFKADRKNKFETIETALDCWNRTDDVVKNMFADNKLDRDDRGNKHLTSFIKHIERKIDDTNNKYAYIIFSQAKDIATESDRIGKTNQKLAKELSASAERLMVVAWRIGEEKDKK